MYKEATNSKFCILKIKWNKSLLLETDGEVRTCMSSRTPNHEQQFHKIFTRSGLKTNMSIFNKQHKCSSTVYSAFAPQIVEYINIIVT